MIALESGARLVITDSGGVQKEAYFFGKPGVVLRPETEWVELVRHGQATLADADPTRITAGVEGFLRDGIPTVAPLFGDGHAAERICDELLNSSSVIAHPRLNYLRCSATAWQRSGKTTLVDAHRARPVAVAGPADAHCPWD